MVASGFRKQTRKSLALNMATPCQGFQATLPVPIVQLSNSRIEHASAPSGHSPLATFSAEHLYSRDSLVCLPREVHVQKVLFSINVQSRVLGQSRIEGLMRIRLQY